MTNIDLPQSFLIVRSKWSANLMWAFLLTVAFQVNAESIDQRQIIVLTEAQRAHVLGEMQDMLSGTQIILAALADNDMNSVARQARLLGMKKGAKAEKTLHELLPKDFMQLGMSVHRAFDQIAADAETFKDSEYTLRQLSNAMVTCGACHQSYQLQVGVSNQLPSSLPINHDH